MRISPINNNYNVYNANKQNFKGIISHDENAIKALVGDKKEAYDKVTDAKDVDIYVFGHAIDSNGNYTPGYAGIVSLKKDGEMMGFKCPKTEKGLKEAKHKIKQAVIWANAPSNLIAAAAIDPLAQDQNKGKNAEKLQEDLKKSYLSQERIVWKNILSIKLHSSEQV